MTFFIAGGSNSVFKDGWVSSFSTQVSKPCVNRSVGATTTLSGIYRLLLPNGPSEGDCVIWEYAVNEINHIGQDYDTDTVLKNVEHLILLCQQRGCRLAPMIFTPRQEETAPMRGEYFERLNELFAHYGISTFDVSIEYRKRFGVGRIPDNNFQDNFHYARTPEMMSFIADGAVALINSANIPVPAKPVYTGGRSLALINGFQSEVFSNSLMEIPVANVPINIELTLSGRIIAICALCFTGFDSGIRMELHDVDGNKRKMRFSTTHKKEKPIQQLKAISIESSGTGDWRFSSGFKLKFFAASKGGIFYSDHTTKRKLHNPVRPPPVISGVLVEIDGV